MITTTHPAKALLALALFAIAPLAGCSSDETDAGPATTDETAQSSDASTDTGTGTGTDGASGTDRDDSMIRETLEIPDDVPLGAYISGIEVAMKPDKVEVDGTVVHVYLAEDNNKVPAGTECMILTSVLPPENSAVVHRGGETTEC